jgi:hypothetical protein
MALDLRSAPTRRSTAGLLSQAAEAAQDRDAATARLARTLLAATAAADLAGVTGGMSLQVWLEHRCRCTRAEGRDLLACVDVLAHLPATSAGLVDGWLSWSQVAAICRAARRVPVARRGELDRRVADAMVFHRDGEPDALVADVWGWVDRQQPSRLERDEAAAERGRFLTLAPRLFGGGSLYGELDPVGFTTVAEALDAPLGPPVAAPDDLDDTAVEHAHEQLDGRRRALTRGHGRRLADRLVGLCERDLAGTRPTAGAAATDAPDDAAVATGRTPRPLLLATVDLEALLDRTRTPGWLLHTLAGGRMRISTSALQRLVDARGADLRTVVLDDVGQIVGVGRRSHVPPGWLREAIWARDTVVADPDRTCPAPRPDIPYPTPPGPPCRGRVRVRVRRRPAGPRDGELTGPAGTESLDAGRRR